MDYPVLSGPSLVLSSSEWIPAELTLLEQWLHGKSAGTIRAYRDDIERFRCFVRKPVMFVRLEDLQDWQDELGIELQQSSVRRKLAALKSFLRFLHQTGYLQWDVGVALKLPKTRNTLVDRILTADEIESMIRFERNRRNRLMLRTMYLTAIRVSEVCSLKWRDLRRSKDGGQLNVFGKGSKTRAIWIPSELFESLVSFKRHVDGKPSDPIFASRKARGHMTPMAVWNIVRVAARRVGIERDVSPHWIRHTHATEALHAGAPMDLLKATMGHESIATTGLYLHASPTQSTAKFLERGNE